MDEKSSTDWLSLGDLVTLKHNPQRILKVVKLTRSFVFLVYDLQSTRQGWWDVCSLREEIEDFIL
jgi:hypothetical protein